MKDYPKSIKRLLREYMTEAHERELICLNSIDTREPDASS